MTTLEVTANRGQASLLKKAAPCLRCRLFEQCPGYYRRYAESFGDHLLRPSGPLLRDEPLPEALLAPYASREAEPPDGPAPSARSLQDVRARGHRTSVLVERMARCLERMVPPPWAVRDLRVDGDAPPYDFLFGACLPDEPPCVVRLAANRGQNAYLRSEHWAISHQGTTLSPREDALLRHIHRVLSRMRGEDVAALLRGS